ncbi:MAG: glycosyltransferase family 2 protein [Rhodothermaceae bacterium]
MSKEYPKGNVQNNGVRKRYYKNYRKPKYSGYKNTRTPLLKFKKTSVVIPLLNEEESLRTLTQEIAKAFQQIKMDYEIIFIDDGSTDGSLRILKELKKQNNQIRYISFRQNYGKAAALQVGFEEVKGDAVITMDADLQDDPSEIPNLLKKLNEGWDVVSGWKRKRYDPFIKKHTSKFFNYTTRLMSGIKIHDFNCGLKAYRKEVVKSVKLYGELHRYIPVLAKYNGFTVTEIPVKHHPRRYGKTKYGISRFFKGFIDLITVAFTTRYVKRPLHFFGVLGSMAFFLGFLVNAYLTYEWFFHNISLTRRPLLLFGILMIIVGVQLFSVGLIGEMLVYNKHNTKEYEVKEKN